MRICLISREYPPETGYGGIATFTKHLAHGLKELGHDVEVVALAKEKEYIQNDAGISVHRVLPIKLARDMGMVNRCMPCSRYVLITTLALWRKFFSLHQEKPFDVIDAPELLGESIYSGITRVAPLLIRLYTPHSKFMAENLHNVAPSFDHLFATVVERVAMLSADVLSSPSEDLADFVAADLNYPREKIQIVRNPIDPQEFSPEGVRALPEAIGKTILFVGRLEERKGINYLVEAIPSVLAEFPDTRFVIIGDDTVNAQGGQRSVLADLKLSLDRAGAGHSVKFVPRIPLTELPAYYRSADISVVPSLYDNSPYTCLEAMSCGRAVIGTSAGGTREYIVDGESGLIVPPRDSQAISEAILRLLKNDEYRNRLGSNARTRVMEKFQRTTIAKEMLALYDLAKENFAKSNKPLYLRDKEQLVPDAAVMMYCFDQMLYNMLYQHSLRFRFSHLMHFLKDRPRLFLAKALLMVARPAARLFKAPADESPAIIRWLEARVQTKRPDPLDAIKAFVGSRQEG